VVRYCFGVFAIDSCQEEPQEPNNEVQLTYGDSLKVVNVQLSLERLELGLSEPPDEEGLVDRFSRRAVRRQRRPKHVNGYGDESELTWEGHH
jgi:hypothetical protein